MKSVGLARCILTTGTAWLLVAQFAQAQAALSPRAHAPRILQHVHEGHPTVSDSTNWSGYAVTGNNITYVSGSWVVPQVTCGTTTKGKTADSTSYASFWVGIDGWTSPTVEQIGTDSDCVNRRAVYYAWYEFYPQNSSNIASLGNLAPGDIMTASVTYNTDGSFTLAMSAYTSAGTGQIGNYQTTITPSSRTGTPARNSAEWITEAPSSGRILPLSNFGTVSWGPDYSLGFGADSATVNGANGSIGSATFAAVLNESIMVGKSAGAYVPISEPAAVSGDGTSFQVNRVNPTVP